MPLRKTSIRVFHACIVTTMTFVATVFMDSYTSPIEDDLLKEGIFNEKNYPMFVSISFLGALISSFIVGPISEWLGSKSVLVIFSPFTIIGSFLLVLASDSTSMILGKGLIGVYSGLAISCAPVYNAEISPPNVRKFYGSLLGVAVRFGVVLSYSLGIWITYRWLALVYMLLITIVILNLAFIPESPKWLTNKGMIEQAERATAYFCSSSHVTERSVLTKITYLDSNMPVERSTTKKIKSYLVWPVLRPMLVCASIHIFKTSSGYEFLLSYSSHTLEKGVNIDPNVVALFYGIFLLCGSLLFLLISHKVNWKRLLLMTTFVQFLSNLLLGIVFYLSINIFQCSHNSQSIFICDILLYAPILLVSSYAFTMALGWGSLSYWLFGEILHHHYIRISAGIIIFVSYMSAYLNELIAPLVAVYFGTDVAFIGYAAMCFIGFLTQCFY